MTRAIDRTPWPRFLERLMADGAPDLVIRAFESHYRQLAGGVRGWIPENIIQPLDQAPDAERIEGPPAGRGIFDQTVVIKLNGGLGTGMGLERAKSLIMAREGLTFLDLIVRQILHLRRQSGIRLPLILMNSFRTDDDTRRALAAYPELAAGQPGIPLRFLQHRVPKILQNTLEPAEWPAQPELEWCPPGHGDLYTALIATGLLDRLLGEGFAYAFVSNADNLGATLDAGILGYFAERNIPFMMEAADRTEADRKGGHVARSIDGLLLRELAQCPESDLDAFQDIRKHRYFNSNNLWINLPALARKLAESGNLLNLPLIVNRKTLDPKDNSSPAVFQLETAMGAAIALFPDAVALRIPRSRFAPVKNTNDLLALRSDAYVLTEDGRVTLHPDRNGCPPVVDLDPAHYRNLDDFEKRFPHGAPSLLACDRLVLVGPHCFGRNVIAEKTVELRADNHRPVCVEDGTKLSG